MNRLQRRALGGRWGDDLHSHRLAGREQGFGTGRDFEILLHQPALQEEARRVRQFDRIPEGLHHLSLCRTRARGDAIGCHFKPDCA